MMDPRRYRAISDHKNAHDYDRRKRRCKCGDSVSPRQWDDHLIDATLDFATRLPAPRPQDEEPEDAYEQGYEHGYEDAQNRFDPHKDA